MNITPTKKQASNRKEIKRSGQRVAPEDQPEEPAREGFKLNKKTVVIIAVISVLVLVGIIVPIALLVGRDTSPEITFVDGTLMQTPLQSGGSFQSQPFQVSKNGKKVPFTINKVLTSGRITQEGNGAASRVCYYHKDTQISVSFDSSLKPQIRIPGDTGLDSVLSSAPIDSEDTLEKLPDELPKALQSELQQKTGLKMTVSTEVSYDGVYNPTTNQYRLLTQQKAYHPEEFAKIKPEERDLCDPKPANPNFNDIKDVTSKIAQTISVIAVNARAVMQESQVKLEGAKEGSEVTKCVRVGDEVLRCSQDVWRSGELKVSNINDPNPLEVWEIVMTAQ